VNKTDKIQELEKIILKHKILYDQGRPSISDQEYDLLESQLRQLSPDSSVLTLIGTTSSVAKSKKIPHGRKMLSLAKVYDRDDLKKWIDQKKVIGCYKIDGMSCSLIYEKGKLVLAKSRGDGEWGEDLTEKMMWIDSIPKTMDDDHSCEVRGEIFCEENDFHLLAQEMLDLHLTPPTSARNIVAGLMGRKEYLSLCRYLRFFAFDVGAESVDEQRSFYQKHHIKSEGDKYCFLQNHHFTIPPYVLLDSKDKDHELVLNQWMNQTQYFMETGSYGVDGIVWTYDDLSLHFQLGETSHHPRYRMAFKFAGVFKETTIVNIEWNISRQGILTPVAVVEPVELSGALVSRVTLHHFGLVKQLNLKVGDRIEIIRSGEVIPKLSRVIQSTEGIFLYPDHCPVCHQQVQIENIRLFCSNKDCAGKNLEGLIDFVQKLGIEDIGPRRLEEMVEKGLVRNIPDLFYVKEEDFYRLDKVKDKMAKKMFQRIQQAKEVDLAKLLGALGLQGGGQVTCEKILSAGYHTIDHFFHLTKENLEKLDGFAEKSAEAFIESWNRKKPLVKDLIAAGLIIRSFAPPNVQQNNLTNASSFCITGTLSRPRKEIEQLIKNAGGKIMSQVSSQTDYLVANQQENSSKYKTALKLNISIVDEYQLEELLKIKKNL
jgi:DNA ligase (NAD+)